MPAQTRSVDYKKTNKKMKTWGDFASFFLWARVKSWLYSVNNKPQNGI